MASGRILVVDDEKFFQELFREVLGAAGHQTRTAGSGEEALPLLADDHFDLLLTDVVMPGMNGRQLAEQLLAKHPQTKVLYMSGYTDDIIVRHGVLDGKVSFIGKPYTLEQLASKLREVLSG
jgi:CheY-like chemotaxis protein